MASTPSSWPLSSRRHTWRGPAILKPWQAVSRGLGVVSSFDNGSMCVSMRVVNILSGALLAISLLVLLPMLGVRFSRVTATPAAPATREIEPKQVGATAPDTYL